MQNQCKKRHLVAKIGTNTGYKLHHLLAKLGTNTSDATFKLISVRKMIQVIEAMPWVRCASGNVLKSPSVLVIKSVNGQTKYMLGQI